MNYNEAMKFIHGAKKFGSKLGLERTQKILELIGNPHKKIKCIHVAGTNGKGSITAMISKILEVSGYKVGMYTSPYIEEFEERIQINNKNIDKIRLAALVTTIKDAVDKVKNLEYGNPTEFEIITCCAFLYFYEEKVDFAVMEVGLGGRLDSTNVINPILSLITSISLDHTNILGDTLEKIAIEKCGIIKEKTPVVVYPQKESVKNIISRICKEKNSKAIYVENNNAQYLGVKNNKQIIKLNVSKEEYKIELALLGKHQILNCLTALYAIEEIKKLGYKITKDKILEALSIVKWPGRLEIMNTDPLVVLDGAHNIDGIINLKENINKYFKCENIYLIIGILADKQVENMIKVIAPMAKEIIAVTPNNDRAKDKNALRDIIKKYNNKCEAYDSYEDAYIHLLNNCTKNDIIIITGSLYMIGDMRKLIKKQESLFF